MKLLSVLLALVAAAFPIAESRADNCQFTFQCQGNICERAAPGSCSANIPAANVSVSAPQPLGSKFDSTPTGAALTSPALTRPDQGSDGSTGRLLSPSGPGCAENGSCYGDLSNINGLPKTTHVNGYFRKDGTYVRGHYRSSGRR
jgi:hypothetical protein